MQVEEYEEMIQAQEEHLAAHLFGRNYDRLSPELQQWVRGRVIQEVWSEYALHGPVAAA
jgi:hypothetical protein